MTDHASVIRESLTRCPAHDPIGVADSLCPACVSFGTACAALSALEQELAVSEKSRAEYIEETIRLREVLYTAEQELAGLRDTLDGSHARGYREGVQAAEAALAEAKRERDEALGIETEVILDDLRAAEAEVARLNHDAAAWEESHRQAEVALAEAKQRIAYLTAEAHGWQPRLAEAEAERDNYRFWNERVRTCENHTNDVIDGECLVCEVARLREALREIADYIASGHREGDSDYQVVIIARAALAREDAL